MVSRLNVIMKYEVIQKLMYYLCTDVNEVTSKWIQYDFVKYHVS
jgi:hypothetical protein